MTRLIPFLAVLLLAGCSGHGPPTSAYTFPEPSGAVLVQPEGGARGAAAVPGRSVTLSWPAPAGEWLTNCAFQIWHTADPGALFTFGKLVSVTNTDREWTLLTNVVGVTSLTLAMRTNGPEFFRYSWRRVNLGIWKGL